MWQCSWLSYTTEARFLRPLSSPTNSVSCYNTRCGIISIGGGQSGTGWKRVVVRYQRRRHRHRCAQFTCYNNETSLRRSRSTNMTAQPPHRLRPTQPPPPSSYAFALRFCTPLLVHAQYVSDTFHAGERGGRSLDAEFRNSLVIR